MPNSKVKVTFIDEATGDSFGATEMPPGDLPESFEFSTTLHIGQVDWSVIDAQPKRRSEYTETKSLTLRLRRIEKVDPRQILFSLPSICDAIPGVSEQLLSGNEFILGEDDWRQLELVSCELSAEVDEEIAKIRLIHENASAGVGWREIHVRKKPELPLMCALELDHLVSALGVSEQPVGVAYRGSGTLIADGFAIRGTELTVYGVVPRRFVEVIAFDKYSAPSPSVESIERLKALARDLRLELVDWCRCARMAPNDPGFGSLLGLDEK